MPGPAEGGRGYLISVQSEDHSLLQSQDGHKVAAVKRDVKRYAKLALRNHYANPDAKMYGPEPEVDFFPHNGRVRLPHGVELHIAPIPMAENPDNVKYEVASGFAEAVWAVPHLIDTVQSAINKKTNKKLIRLRADEYKEWWLVVTDPQYALNINSDDAQTIADSIHYDQPWRRILLVKTNGDKVSRVIELTTDVQA